MYQEWEKPSRGDEFELKNVNKKIWKKFLYAVCKKVLYTVVININIYKVVYALQVDID